MAARVLVPTTYDTDSDVLPALEAGATGYLLKDAPKEELFRAVEETAQGKAVLSPAVAGGATNREAAKQLFISEATVKTHLLHLYTKLGVNDRAAAVAAGFARGYLTGIDPQEAE